MVSGFMEDSECLFLQECCKDKVVLEIGSLRGKSSVAIAWTARVIYCNDTFSADGNGQTQFPKITTLDEFLLTTSGYTNIIPFVGKSAKVIPLLPDNMFDIVFIDADHQYKSVIEDILVSFSKLKDEGFFLFHDYTTWPGVKKGVDELFDSPEVVNGSIAKAYKSSIKVEERKTDEENVQ